MRLVLPVIALVGCSGGFEADAQLELAPRYDLDADGIEDVVVGAPSANENAGELYVFFGDVALDGRSSAQADLILRGSHPFQFFGRSFSACDFDGDGIGDLLVGGGGVQIWWGGPELGARETPDLAVSGTDALGQQVMCGDVTGDGFADLVTLDTLDGAPALLVFAGGPGRRALDVALQASDADVVLPGDLDTRRFADAALELADIDGDGVLDLLVGSGSLVVDGQWGAGGVHVFRGGVGLVSGAEADVVLTGAPESFFGRSLAAVDMDADGVYDLAVGALSGQLAIYRGGDGFGQGGPDVVLGRPEVAVDDPAWSASVQRAWRPGLDDLHPAAGMLQVRARLQVNGAERQGALFIGGVLDEPHCMGVVTEEPLRMADAIAAVRLEDRVELLLGAPGTSSANEGRVFAFAPAALGLEAAQPCREAVQSRLTADLGAARISGPRGFGAAMGN